MKPERANPQKWAAYGALFGLTYAAFQADYTVVSAGLAGEFVGSAVGGAVALAVAALVQNLFIR